MNFIEEMKKLQKQVEEENRAIHPITTKAIIDKLEKYEKALKEIAESNEDTSCNEIALKYEVIAEKALNS